MDNFFRIYHNFKSREVNIGNLTIGGNHPVVVQSMTNTNTIDTDATVKQVIQLAEAGCDIVRITAPSIKEAESLAGIKNQLINKGYHLPLVADIHFTPKPAEVAARIVEKVRINPGNYVDRNRGKTDWSAHEINEAQERIAERLIPLLKICIENETAIRIGTNHGSLSERILSMYGNTARGMVESAMEFVRICNSFGFHNLVLSMKASNVKEMTAANILLVEQMISEGFYYPVHLGVTEAGNASEARIKSAAGIGNLLARGIGDTVRVSLAEDPVFEVPVGKKLTQFYGRRPSEAAKIIESTELIEIESEKSLQDLSGVKYPVLNITKDTKADLVVSEAKRTLRSHLGGANYAYTSSLVNKYQKEKKDSIVLKRNYSNLASEDLILRAATDFSILTQVFKDFGIWLQNGSDRDPAELTEVSLEILQALGLRYTKTEFIACPSCGRTKFNLFESFNKVKEKTSHLTGLQIAVMGCVVNGPGEMGDADYGYIGAGPGKVTLYKNGIAVAKNVNEAQAVEELIQLIKESGDWADPS